MDLLSDVSDASGRGKLTATSWRIAEEIDTMSTSCVNPPHMISRRRSMLRWHFNYIYKNQSINEEISLPRVSVIMTSLAGVHECTSSITTSADTTTTTTSGGKYLRVKQNTKMMIGENDRVMWWEKNNKL